MLPRPLDPVRSIKIKLGVLLVALRRASALGYFWYGIGLATRSARCGHRDRARPGDHQVLAHGMTSPLREMTAAARAMARGDYTRRVRATRATRSASWPRRSTRWPADLAAADRQRRELVANVSHELRTPVSALRAVLENIVDGVAEPDPATLRAALAQTERLGRLVTELLDLSRIEAGAYRCDADAVRRCEPSSTRRWPRPRSAGRRRSRRAVRRPSTRRTLTVLGDRDRLHQVVANLLDNAARHSPPGGTVRVSAGHDGDRPAARGDATRARASPPDERDRVFERFNRGERATGGGTGLGLAIARWVVDLHGGAIAVVDRPPPGRPPGCRIRVSIPCDGPHREEAA